MLPQLNGMMFWGLDRGEDGVLRSPYMVASLAPDMIILQLETNDLSRLDPLVVGSSMEKLVTTLYEKHNVKLNGVCKTLLGSTPVFNTRVRTINKYVKTFLEPYVVVWEHFLLVMDQCPPQ